MNFLTLDCETLKWSEEVTGGFKNPQDFGLSVLVVKSSDILLPVIYVPDSQVSVSTLGLPTVSSILLEKQISQADLIVSFNGIRFDYGVLEGAGFNIEGWEEKSYDILQEFHKANDHKFRVSLDSVAKSTLGEPKQLDGLSAVHLWRCGKRLLINRESQSGWIGAKYLFQSVIDYCVDDVKKTEAIFRYLIANNGQIKYFDKYHQKVKSITLPIPKEICKDV